MRISQSILVSSFMNNLLNCCLWRRNFHHRELHYITGVDRCFRFYLALYRYQVWQYFCVLSRESCWKAYTTVQALMVYLYSLNFGMNVMTFSPLESTLWVQTHLQLKWHSRDNQLLRNWAWILTHWGRVTHICVSKLTIIGWTAPSHYLNQCWIIVNWNLRNKLEWNLRRNS